MKFLASLFHPGKEWDRYTQSWVPKGWVAKRQALADIQEAALRADPENYRGTCIQCGLRISLHPIPQRLWRSRPEFCAYARERNSLPDDQKFDHLKEI